MSRTITLDRRRFLLGALAAGWSLDCSSSSVLRPRLPTQPAPSISLWSWFDLPQSDPRSRELSGLAWDPTQNVLWAVHDEHPSIISLVPSHDLKTWAFGESIELKIDGPVDLEGLVVIEDGFIIASEEGPRVIEVDRRGNYRRDVKLPERFRDARHNNSLESLTLSPSGRYLFTTTEAALHHDGEKATTNAGTRVRIMRLERSTTEWRQAAEYVYESDPMQWNGDFGISDLAALSDNELLVLERGWARDHGNTVRIYQTNLDTRASCLGVDELSSVTPLGKKLWLDLASLEATGCPPAKQVQANPLLDNFEGLTLGPHLPDGRPTILVASDDNGHPDQVARVLVLAAR